MPCAAAISGCEPDIRQNEAPPMLVFKRVDPLQAYLDSCRSEGARVGFVPTMGALHEGHGSLLRCAGEENDLTVCSIFVNPTQFNESSDLEKYPRTPVKDVEMLSAVGTDVLFFPPVAEIYPPGVQIEVPGDFGRLGLVMEGAFRPGHFEGVARVVRRLLDIVRPHRLYMGQKDYQQYTIIQHLIDALELSVQLVRCPIVREADGLAMSSRNQRLSPAARRRAPAIYRVLEEARRALADADPPAVAARAWQQLERAGLRPEYFEIVDGRTLEPLETLAGIDHAVACAAAWAGEVRLIDNVLLLEDGRPVPA